MENKVDFAAARAVKFGTVLGALNIQLTDKGDELVGICPLHEYPEGEKKVTFGVNPEKGVFNCFACKKKGSVIDFVAYKKGVKLKEAAEWILSLTKTPTDELIERLASRLGDPKTLKALLT